MAVRVCGTVAAAHAVLVPRRAGSPNTIATVGSFDIVLDDTEGAPAPTVDWIPVDTESPDFARFPLFKHATPVRCTVKAGEMLVRRRHTLSTIAPHRLLPCSTCHHSGTTGLLSEGRSTLSVSLLCVAALTPGLWCESQCHSSGELDVRHEVPNAVHPQQPGGAHRDTASTRRGRVPSLPMLLCWCTCRGGHQGKQWGAVRRVRLCVLQYSYNSKVLKPYRKQDWPCTWNLTFNECIQVKRDKSCPQETFDCQPDNTLTAFLCGTASDCTDPSSPEALARALHNLQYAYVAVGILEDVPVFIELLARHLRSQLGTQQRRQKWVRTDKLKLNSQSKGGCWGWPR